MSRGRTIRRITVDASDTIAPQTLQAEINKILTAVESSFNEGFVPKSFFLTSVKTIMTLTSQLVEEITCLQAQKAVAVASYEESRRTNQIIHTRLVELTTRLDEAQTIIADHNMKKILSEEKPISSAHSSKASSKSKAVDHQVRELSSKLDKTNNKIAELTAENERLKSQKNEAESALAVLKTQLIQNKSSITELEIQLAGAKSEFERKLAEIQDQLKSEQAKVQADITAKQSKIAELEAQNAELRAKLAADPLPVMLSLQRETHAHTQELKAAAERAEAVARANEERQVKILEVITAIQRSVSTILNESGSTKATVETTGVSTTTLLQQALGLLSQITSPPVPTQGPMPAYTMLGARGYAAYPMQFSRG